MERLVVHIRPINKQRNPKLGVTWRLGCFFHDCDVASGILSRCPAVTSSQAYDAVIAEDSKPMNHFNFPDVMQSKYQSQSHGLASWEAGLVQASQRKNDSQLGAATSAPSAIGQNHRLTWLRVAPKLQNLALGPIRPAGNRFMLSEIRLLGGPFSFSSRRRLLRTSERRPPRHCAEPTAL